MASSSEKPSRSFGKRRGGLQSMILRQPGGYSAEILFYGAQVISWKNARGEELLFVPGDAVFQSPHPIRGGIPICFPKVCNNEGIEKHGFARCRSWNFDFKPNFDPTIPVPTKEKHASVDLILNQESLGDTNWPNRFELRLRVILGPTGDLMMIFRVKNLNSDGKPFTFPFSFQNYLSVFDIGHIEIGGLENKDYLDYMQNKQHFNQGPDVFTFESAVDRLYLDTRKNKITITDNLKKRMFTVSRNVGLPDIVVWNPSDKRMESARDFEYMQMVCVEAAAMENEITLRAGDEWMATQCLSVAESSRKRQKI